MNISLNLLKKYVDLSGISIDDIGDALMEHVFEIDDIIDKRKDFQNIIVGKIEKLEKHPNADKLTVCYVRIKEQHNIIEKIFNKDKDVDNKNILQIVCGGKNLREGMYVIVALPGSLVKWHGEGDLVEIQNTELRGIKSFGMICASSEIGLSDIFPAKDEFEIIDLDSFKDKIPNPIKIGENIADLLGYNDIVIEIDNKVITNRPDLWGHYGIARELAAIFKRELKPIEINKSLPLGRSTQLKVYMEAPDLCKTYNAVRVSGITVGGSPKWLKDFIISFGLNSINNIVDLANYVMYEVGQPLHCFDANKITNKVFVRMGKIGEEMQSFDGTILKIDENVLVIADSLRPIAVAGIIGSEDSAVKDTTNSIVLEAANFDYVTVRKTMQKYGFRTDAGSRYEKQLDPELALVGMRRFLTLLKEMCPRISIELPLNFDNFDKEEKNIFIDFEFIRNKIGADIDDEYIKTTLTSLGFGVKQIDEKTISISVPSFRKRDISIKEDIVEEISRMYGYNNIESLPINTSLTKPINNGLRDFERETKSFMIANGFSEVLNYSFVSSSDLNDFNIDESKAVKLINSLTVNQNILRTTLLINLLKNVKDNLRFKNDFRIFEIGRVFDNSIESDQYENLPFQNYYFAGIITAEEKDNLFFDIRGVIDNFLKLFKFDFEYVVKDKEDIPLYCHFGRYVDIYINKEKVGYISEFSPELLIKYKIKQKVGIFEIDFEKLFSLLKDNIYYKQISKFQKSEIDLSVIVDKDVLWKDMKAEILRTSEYIESVKLFDIYTGDKIGDDKKSLAFRMTFSNPNRNLNQYEIDSLWKQVYENLNEKFEAEIRK